MTQFHGAPQRAEDRSLWFRISAALDKYKLLVWLLGLVLVGAGFGWETPRAALALALARIDSLEAAVRQGSEERALLREMVLPLLRGQCLDRPARELALMGVDCARLGISPSR